MSSQRRRRRNDSVSSISDDDSIRSDISDDGSSSDDGSDYSIESAQSMPEMKDLEETVMERYTINHPKDMIPLEEKIVALSLREFNDAYFETEEEYEDREEEIEEEIEELMKLIKKVDHRGSKNSKKHKKKIEALKNEKKKLKRKFIEKKHLLEQYYGTVCAYAIRTHIDPPKELKSILKLLEKNNSTLHAICVHLSFFAYIDDDLEEESDEELPDIDSSEDFLIHDDLDL